MTKPVARLRAFAATAALVLTASIGALSAPAAQAAEGGYQALEPSRILDTREAGGAVGPGQSIDLTVTDTAGVPATGVAAVVVNLTGTANTAPTYITAYPTGSQAPEASNLNLPTPGTTDSNLVIATVGNNGQITLLNGFGTTHLIADITGWYPAGTSYGALEPSRILDTREAGGAVGPGQSIDLQVADIPGVPATGVAAVVVNLTGTANTAPTYITAYPTGSQAPEASNLNLPTPGTTDSNLVIATVGNNGQITLLNGFGTTHLIADITGWLPGAPTAGGPSGTLYFNSTGLQSIAVQGPGPRQTVHDLDMITDYSVNLTRNEFVYEDDERIIIRDLTTKAQKTTFDFVGTVRNLV